MPSHFHSARKCAGSSEVEFGAINGIGQHRRQEGRARIAARSRRALQQPVEQRAVRRLQPVPDFFHGIDRLLADIGDGLLGQSRGDADSQRAGQQLQQRPAAGGIERVQPALQDRRRLRARGALQRLHDLAKRRRRACGGIGLPDQRQRFGQITHIVVGEGEQLLADLLLAEAAQQSGFGRREIEAAGEGRQRPAAIGIGRLAQIGLDQPQLGVARRLEARGHRGGGRRPARIRNPRPRGRRGAAPRHRCRCRAHSGRALPRGRA